jgi:hypothetical protein
MLIYTIQISIIQKYRVKTFPARVKGQSLTLESAAATTWALALLVKTPSLAQLINYIPKRILTARVCIFRDCDYEAALSPATHPVENAA